MPVGEVNLTDGERSSLHCLLFRCRKDGLGVNLAVRPSGLLSLALIDMHTQKIVWSEERLDKFGTLFTTAHDYAERLKKESVIVED